MQRPILFLLLVFTSLGIFAQPWMQEPWLVTRPSQQGVQETSFYDIQNAFNSYWAGRDSSEKGKGWKQFKRWEEFMSPRVYPSGKFYDPSIIYKQYQKYLNNQIANQTISKEANWMLLGPKDNIPINRGGAGRINCIAFHPNKPDEIWAGSAAGGLWKSDDGGVTWSTNTDQFPSLGVTSIAFDPSTPSIMYIATGDGDGTDTYSVGVLKSIDGGVNWDTTGLSWTVTQTRTISKLIVDPINTNVILAAGSNGIWKSTDNAVTWNSVYTGSFKDIEFKPSDPNIVYASGNKVYRSVDNGDTWAQITDSLPSSGVTRIALAVTPANPQVVYALCSKSSSSGYYGLYKSMDDGLTWNEMSTSPNLLGWSSNGSDAGGQGWYDLALAISPLDENKVYVGGVNIWESLDGGVNWQINAHWYGGGAPYVHADHHALEFIANSEVLFTGNDGGVFKTDDGGTVWQDLSDGLQIMQFYRLGASATNNDLIYAGAQDNGTNRYDAGAMMRVIGGDGMEALVDYSDENIVYGELYYGAIRRSMDGGATWTTIAPASNGAWVTPYIINPVEPSILYAGYTDVYKTSDRGNSWNKISNNLTGGGQLRSLAVAPSDTGVIYAATYNAIYTRKDKYSAWTNITSGLPSNSITYITVHPDTADSVWVTLSGYSDTSKVYLSPDGGSNWINVSGSLPNIPVNCIVCENSKYHDLYIGTDLGVYYTNDTLTDWVAYNNRLPNVIVNELEIHESSGQLKAATYGRGLWQTDLVSYNRPITDASINEIQEPSGTSCLDSIDPIVVLRNYGIDTLLNADIYYQLDSDSVFIYSWSGQLPTELKEEIQLPGLSASLGNHSFKVFVSNPNGGVDENYSNDTLVQIFTITGVISSFPYYEDFENNDGGWFTDEDDNFGGPANNTWEWGIPTGPDLDTANSGQKAWGTNLSGAYVNRTAAYLVSPCFDISLLQEPVFEFFMAFEIENNWDAAYVEYSVDYGDNWNKLGDANDPNWYNSSLVGNGSSTGLLCTGAQWEGIDSVSKIMTKYYRSLAPVKGESNLLIRIVMSSDHFVTYDGMVVDDIRIYDAADSSKSPQANFSAKVIEACENDSIEFSDESLFTPISWLWSFQGGSPGSDTIQYPIISYDSSGTYDVTLIVSNALGSDTIVKSTYITVNENPSILIGITDVTCFGDTTGYIDLNVTGGTPPYYYWWSNGKISQDLPDVAVGNYYVTISDAKNCKVLKSATVNEPDKMKMVWQKKDIVCKDSVGYIDVIASGGTNIFSYLWSNGAIDSINTGLTAGLYYLTILDGNKCELQDTIRILQLNTNMLLSKTDIDCYEENIGSATVKVSDNSPPYSYFWSNSDSVSSIDSLYSGTYIVSVINSDNCLSIDSITILQPESIFVDVVLDDISCNGFNDGSISVSTYGGVSPYIYAWSQGGSVPDLLNLLPGDYTLTVIDNNDCSKNWNYNIDEPDTISIVYYVDSANYSMADGSINVSVFGGTTPYSYAWSSSSTAANLDSVYGGVFGLLVNDLNGCEDSVVIIIPTLYQLLIANAGKDSIYCIGDTIVLGAAPSATGGAPPYSYNWEIKCCSTFVKFPGPSLDDSTQSNPVIVNIPKFEPDSFAYVLTVTDSVGNVAIDTVNLMVAGTYFDTSAIYEFSIFQGDSIRLAVSASLVYDPITYLWNPTDGLSDSTTGRPWASPDTTTLYSLTETDPGGCQLVQTALVTVFGVGIKENFGNFIGLNIYPNPNLGKFVLEIELQGKAEFQIQLTSINGQIIYSESVDTSFYKKEIDFSGYAKGVYTLKVVSDGGVVYRKIVYQ